MDDKKNDLPSILHQALDRFDSLHSVLYHQSPYQHQVAGHTKEVVCKYKDYILKPLVKPDLFLRECALYEELHMSYTEEDRFMFPTYYGVVQASTSTNEIVYYIVLSDLTKACKVPCIIDIKMGKQTYEPSVSNEKKSREKLKYIYQDEIGFRITGLKVYDIKSEVYTTTGKQFGRSLLPQQVLHGLSLFFYNSPSELRIDVIEIVMSKLKLILEWMLSQTHFQFYCSSILIIYDAVYESHVLLQDSIQVKMIDLAHTIRVNGQIDEGYIFGLKNLIAYLEKLVTYDTVETVAERYANAVSLMHLPDKIDFFAREPL
jgi:1D-myo-inositol-tetrakisphosphate 5-kinase/inositol-polyphosphate multikinase